MSERTPLADEIEEAIKFLQIKDDVDWCVEAGFERLREVAAKVGDLERVIESYAGRTTREWVERCRELEAALRGARIWWAYAIASAGSCPVCQVEDVPHKKHCWVGAADTALRSMGETDE